LEKSNGWGWLRISADCPGKLAGILPFFWMAQEIFHKDYGQAQGGKHNMGMNSDVV
jgi:hypothetical protein